MVVAMKMDSRGDSVVLICASCKHLRLVVTERESGCSHVNNSLIPVL